MAKASEKLSYAVIGRLRYDHENYAPGETVEMTEDQAAPLIEIGVLTVPEAATSEDDKPGKLTKTALGKMKVAALQEYAKSVNVEIPEGATKDGIIAAILGEGA